MDMALYALLKNQLSEQTECKTWNGFKIEVVDKLPKKQILADREALENENEQMENELFILREKIADIILTIQELNS